MNTRTIVALTLPGMLVVPAAGVEANTQSQSPVTDAEPALRQADPGDSERNYTRLYVDDQYQNLRLQPGESETITITVENGEEVDAERVSVTNSGSVNLGDTRRATADDGTYASRGERQTFEYRLDDPEDGSWSVEIMPENAMQFSYDIVRNESA